MLRWYLSHERVILASASFVGFFLIWQLASTAGLVNKLFFSSPLAIADTAWNEVQNPRLWSDFRISGTEMIVGYVAAVVLGVPLGLVGGWYRRLNYFFDPWLNFMNSLPRVALLPLIVLWVGIGIWSKIVVVFLGAFFMIMMNTLYGVRTVDRHLLDVASSFGASQRRMFVTVVLPGSLPFILAGLRLGVGRAVIGVIVGELYAANAGLGYMIVVAGQTLQTSRLLFAVILLTAMGVVSVEALRVVERRFQQWRPRVGAAA